MSLDKTGVEHVAQLARLSVEESEVPEYQRDLSAILDLVRQLDSADTGNIEPLAHPLELAARMRPDAVTETDRRELFQSVAPSVSGGYYLVPRVID
jgi:aspartyl-tRNA(Asn)/glutamyl-tRNA(Gln) amidotransferase subunit C